jgi:multiple sugar transport system substrate-binding protein
MTPVAAVLREQANAPFNSFITEHYMEITHVLGLEIQRALRGQQTAAQALTAAEDAVRALQRSLPGQR